MTDLTHDDVYRFFYIPGKQDAFGRDLIIRRDILGGAEEWRIILNSPKLPLLVQTSRGEVISLDPSLVRWKDDPSEQPAGTPGEDNERS